MALKKPSELFENNGNDSSRESEEENRQEEINVNKRVISPKQLFGEIEEEIVVEEIPVIEIEEEVIEVPQDNKSSEDINKLVQEKIGEQTEDIQERLKEKFDEYSEKFEDKTKKYYQNLSNQFNVVKENLIKKVSSLEVDLIRNEQHLRDSNVDVDQIREDIGETIQRLKSEIIEDVAVLQEPPSNVTSDPLTPLDQNFVTFDHLNEHYRLFLNRIQQQLTTLGGGGEYRLQYLDDIVGIATNPSAYDNKYLKYNHSLKKFEFVSVSGGAGSQTLDQTLALGNSSNAGMTVGVSTFNSVVVGGSNTALVVTGNARVTGILTIGTGSITLNGINDTIRIGTGLTITSTGSASYSGVVTAPSFVGSGASLTGLTGAAAATYGNATAVPQIVVDSNGRITSISNVSISAGGGGGTGINVRDNGSVIGFAGTVDFGSGIDATAISAGITTVFVTYAPVAGIATTATSAYNLYGTPNLNVGVLTATTLNGSGINLTGIVTSIVAGAGITIDQSTGRITITSIGGTVGTYATVGYVDQKITTLVGGAPAILDTLNELALALNDDANFASSIASTLSNKLDLTGGTISGSLQSLGGFVGNLSGTASNATTAGYAKTAGIATVSGYATNAGVSTYAVNAGVATYAPVAGIATYTPLAGLSTYSTLSGIATYATSAGVATVATNAHTAGIATNAQYAFVAGVSTNAFVAGIATVATNAYNAGVATVAVNAYSSGIATNAYNAGVATVAVNAYNAGIATYATTAGVATVAQGLTGTPNINVGSVTATSFVKSGGTSSQFLKADGSVDSSTYATQSYVGLATVGLASVSYVNNQTGLATVGLASLSYVTTQVGLGTAGLASLSYVTTQTGLSTVGLSSVSYVNTQVGLSTVGLASLSYVNNQTGLSTVGLASLSYVTTQTGLSTAGLLNSSGSAANLTSLTGASAATYGNASAVPQIVVDANGRITSITNVAISGGGGGGGTGLNVKNLGSVVGFAGTIDFGTGLSVTPVSAGVVTVTATSVGGNSGYANTAGIATYATSAGVATNAYNAGIATYAVNSGVATNAYNAGIATSVIGGIASVTALNVSGVSTHVGVSTFQSTIFTNQLTVSGVSTLGGISVNQSTITPSTTLTVAGNLFVNDDLTVNSSYPGIGAVIQGSDYGGKSTGFYRARVDDLGSSRTEAMIIGRFQNLSAYTLYNDGSILTNGDISLVNGANLNVSGVTTTTRLNVGTGGTVITTTSSGLVGIGTTNPTSTLTVGGGTSTRNLYVGGPNLTGVATFYTSGHNTEIDNSGLLIYNIGGASRLDPNYLSINTSVFGGTGSAITLQPDVTSSTGQIKFLSRTGLTGGALKFRSTELDLSLSGSANISGVVTATSFVGTGASFAGISTFSGIATHTTGLFGSNASFIGVVTASSFSGSASNLTGLTGAGAATYGNASAVPQIVVDANGRITSISNVAISGGGGGGGTGVNIKSVGSVVGFAGTIDFGLGFTVTPVSAGIVTINQSYVATSGISTDVIGGIASVTSLNVTGLSTFGGITTVTGNTLFAKQANVSGVSTFGDVVSLRDSSSTYIINARYDQIAGFQVGAGYWQDRYLSLSTNLNYILPNVGIGTTNATNTLTVGGGTSTRNLYVSGISTIPTIAGATFFSNTTESTSKDDGSVVFDGGVGIEKRLNVGGNFSSLGSYANFGVNSSLQFDVGASESPNVRIRNIYANGRIRMDSVSGIDLEQYNNASAFRARFDDTNVNLYSQNSLKLQTIGAGVTITGTNFTNQLNVSGVSTFNSNANITDNNKILLGSGSNFEMYFDSSNTIFQNKSTNTAGDLYIRSDAILLQKYDGSQTIAQFTRDAGVKLNYQGITKLETTADGFVTGSTDVAHLNQLKIGTIGANQSDGRTLTATPSGLVGIGTTNPTNTLTVNGGIGATSLTVSGLSTFNGTTRFNTNTGYIQFDSANSYLYFRDNQQIVFGNGNNISMSWNGTSGSLSNAGDLLIRNNSVSGVTSIAGNTIGTIADFTQSGQVRVPGQLVVGAGASFAGVSTFTGTTQTQQLSVSGVSTFAGIATFKNANCATELGNQSYDGIRFLGSGSNFALVAGDALGNLTINSQSTTNRTVTINDNHYFYSSNTANVQLNNGDVGTTKVGSAITFTANTGNIFSSTLTVGGGTSTRNLYVSGISTINLNTSSPTQGGLDLVSGSNGKIRLSNDGGATTGSLRFLNGSNQQLATWQSDLTTGSIDIYNYTNSGTSNITLSPGGSVVLNYAGSTSKKFETLGAGVSVTGTTFTNQLNVSGVSTFNGSVRVGTAATQSFVISGVGSVGVGTINPVSSFQVEQYAIENFTGSFTASPGVAANIDAFTISVTDFKTVEYTLHFAYAANIQAQKVLVMQNGTTAYAQEYAIMAEPSLIVSIGATVTAGVCYLQATPEAGISGVTTYRLVRSGML